MLRNRPDQGKHQSVNQGDHNKTTERHRHTNSPWPSFNRQGYVKLSYALQSGARQVLQSLSTDLMEDLGYFDEELSEDGLPLSGSGSGTATTSGGGASLPGGIDLGVSPTAGGGSGRMGGTSLG